MVSRFILLTIYIEGQYRFSDTLVKWTSACCVLCTLDFIQCVRTRFASVHFNLDTQKIPVGVLYFVKDCYLHFNFDIFILVGFVECHGY